LNRIVTPRHHHGHQDADQKTPAIRTMAAASREQKTPAIRTMTAASRDQKTPAIAARRDRRQRSERALLTAERLPPDQHIAEPFGENGKTPRRTNERKTPKASRSSAAAHNAAASTRTTSRSVTPNAAATAARE
jgi:hypothetical protein